MADMFRSKNTPPQNKPNHKIGVPASALENREHKRIVQTF